MTSSFSNLSLAEPLARAVAEMGYETMTPIQAEAIPVVLSGQDVMGAAQTGTGKTAAFSLPLLQRMLKHENASTSPARHPVRALVLLPTGGIGRVIGGADVETGVGVAAAFGAGAGGGGDTVAAFFAAMAATAEPGVITIVFSNSSGSVSELCVSTKRS